MGVVEARPPSQRQLRAVVYHQTQLSASSGLIMVGIARPGGRLKALRARTPTPVVVRSTLRSNAGRFETAVDRNCTASFTLSCGTACFVCWSGQVTVPGLYGQRIESW